MTEPVSPAAAETGLPAPASAGPRDLFKVWPFISGFWVLVMIVTVLQDLFVRRGELVELLLFAATLWLPWALLTPLIVYLSFAWTLERGHWRRQFALHCAASLLVTVLLGMLSHWAGPPPFPRQRNAPEMAARMEPPEPRPRASLAEVIVRRATFQFPIYWAIVGVAHAFIFYDRSRERERHAAMLESRLTKSRLKALQMQLNPHFLFNTLNSIASLVHENPKVADEMISSLSEFLRLTLKTSDRAEVTLREELDFLDHYLAIEQIRFGDRLRVVKNVDASLLSTPVPVLLLQPLVENAIKHGVEKQLGPGLVRITAERAGENLRLQVADNGRGLKATGPEGLKDGVGLANTRARLQELAGAAASLELHTPPEGGLVAEIILPFRRLP